jgi:hypothetical protein
MILLYALAGAFIVGQFLLHMSPIKTWLDRQTWKIAPLNIMSVADIVNLRMQGILTEDEYHSKMKEHGYNEEIADYIFKTTKSYLPVADYINLYRRGLMSRKELIQKLNALGWHEKDISTLMLATAYYPTAPDIIRFAVREVFTKDIVEKFGLMEDIPTEYLKLAEEAGLDKDTAEYYWAAHWELPSVRMGYEMFHRDIIDEKTLKELMRSLDIMPYWRDKLIKLSYNPITRVDVRRMYKLGVLSKSDVKKRYEHLGYSPEDAELLADFVEKYERRDIDEERKRYRRLTRSMVARALRENVIDEASLKKYLLRLGYTEHDATIIVKTEKARLIRERNRETLKYLTLAYSEGKIEEGDLVSELAKMPLTTRQYEYHLEKIKQARERKVTSPSVKDIEEFFKKDIIDVDEAENMLRVKGFNDRHIECYINLWTGGKK